MTSEHGPTLADLSIKIFADGADRDGMLGLYAEPWIKGFTTNPTLMRKAGVVDYVGFARELVELIPDRPISFEVFTDDHDEMELQAYKIASWGENVFVKVPVMNIRGESTVRTIKRLAADGVRLNVTALMTLDQVREVAEALGGETPGFISVFAGRIADTGRDPVPLMAEALRILGDQPNLELMWASPRELLNLFQADAIGCHVITMTSDLLAKLPSVGKDLWQFSLETIEMLHGDADHAGYRIDTATPAPPPGQ